MAPVTNTFPFLRQTFNPEHGLGAVYRLPPISLIFMQVGISGTICQCNTEEQILGYVISDCEIHHGSHRMHVHS